MKKSRLHELFNVLDRDDIKQLQKVVRSPFFNQREHVIQLLDYLVQCKYKKKKAPNKVEAYQSLFPNLTYDDHKLRLSMSLLLKSIEKYLIWKQVSADHTYANLLLSRAFRQLKLARHFNKNTDRLKLIQQKQKLRHAEYYQNAYFIQLEQYRFKSERSRMKGLNLQPVQENLDIAYFTSKLRHICFALSHQVVYKQQYSFGMLDEVINYIEKQDYVRIPAISVYYHCYQALSRPNDDQHFEAFKNAIFKHQDLFPKDELRDLFLLATNYCIRLMNQGEKQFAVEGLSIYREGLQNGVLLLDGRLSRFTYRNIVAKAIIAKEFNWAESFIYQYKESLEAQFRESSFSFNLAWLEYERKNYDEALLLVNRSSFNDLLLNISAKTIAMKIYYELAAFDLLHAHLEAMKSFINRQKTISYHKKNYLNTIRFTQKLLNIPPSDTKLKIKLKKEIIACTSVAEKNWLLLQV